MLKFYQYDKCSTCRNALKFLQTKSIDVKAIPIRESPPSKSELRQMLAHHQGVLTKLFNTSGEEYRRLGLKEKLGAMSEVEALDLLASNGSLVKRPFLIGEGIALNGFKQEEWSRVLRELRNE
jgi:arsenate reductase (glutaredoxin)